ncbi:TldD/PmbA family protein [Synechococcus sp. Nb3U1]|uniref:TldD/PmbA family protein n=1 Tax=Synechococcus sp. Nb3U1 TaxID=1914529 RepID=UPI001F1FCB2F|nr:TldD/PmbA family protein [Synechococcus sp. Nb3U1]MCF2971973.1 TldD/PmbA family protein [Synechococcus sp. Nb3U1]
MASALVSPENLLDLCEQGVQKALAAGADQAEVFANSGRETEVTFEKNDLNLARTSSETLFGVRVFCGGRLGFATSNRPEELADIAAEAVALAKASPADPLNGLPDPQPLPSVPFPLDAGLLDLDAATLTQLGSELLERVRAQDSRINIDSGSISVEEDTLAIASSTGIRANYHSVEGGGSLFGMAIDGEEVGSFAYDGDSVQTRADLIPALERAFDRFVNKCIGALGATQGESFRGTILLPPDSVDELLGDLIAVLGADAVRKGKSPLAQKMGSLIASPLLTVVSEGLGLPGYRIEPFDREGIPRQITPLVNEGILCNFLYNSYESRAAGIPSNGHATGGAGSLPGVGPACLSVAAGKTPLSELYAVERGIIVTRLSGSSNPITGDFSGVVKGGFLVKGGEKRPILETTIAGNLYDCLRNISAISQEVTIFNGSTAFPALRIEDVSVTAG